MENLVLLLSSDRGINIPYDFANDYLSHITPIGRWFGIDKEDIEILKAGPDHGLYWDSWSAVLEGAEWIETGTGKIYRLYQDGDLWAYSVTAQENGELDEFFGDI